MADIKKSFNFRNGLQVDDDNFIINANGLVGIGSTIPTERLDVGGNIRIRGTIVSDAVITSTLTNTSDDGTATFNRVNTGITSITSGIITASGTGIVTYYGDARYLQGMPTSQWIDTDVGLGYTSIYAAGNVGVGTTDPRYTFQVGSTTSSGILTEGVGISSSGYIDLTGGINLSSSSGVISAFSFKGPEGITASFSGFGTNITSLNADELTSGTIPSNRFGDLTVTNIYSSSGIVTASSFIGDSFIGTTFTGNFVGIATTARDLTSDARVDIKYIDVDDANIGFGTFSNAYVSGRIGIGSTSATLADVHVDTDGVASIKIQSHDDQCQLILGRNDNLTNSFAIVTDDTANLTEDSGLNSVDLVNYNPGHLNFTLYPGAGISGKRFNWINKHTNTRLMSLTQTGELGIGVSNPSHDLHVVGTSTVTSDSFIGGDFGVTGVSTFYNTVGFTTTIKLTGLLRSKDRIGVGLTDGDVDPSEAFEVGPGSITLSSSGNATFIGIVTAQEFVGIGSSLTSIKPENISEGTITANTFNIDTISGIITASRFVGSGVSLTNIPMSSLIAGDLNGNINIDAGVGVITASRFVGSGSSLTSIKPESIDNGTISTNLDINTPSGIITASRFVGSGVSLTSVPVSSLTGDGTLSGNLVFSGITTFTSGNIDIPNSEFNINSTGIITASTFVGDFVGSGVSITNIPIEQITGDTFEIPLKTKENVVLGIGVTYEDGDGVHSISMATSNLNQGINTHTVGSAAVGFSTHVVQSGVSSEIWRRHLSDSDEVDSDEIVFRDNYYSTDYQILAINGSNYQTSKVLVLYNGGSVIGIETYSNININNQVARYEASVSLSGIGRTMSLNAIPESGITGLTTYKVYLTSIH